MKKQTLLFALVLGCIVAFVASSDAVVAYAALTLVLPLAAALIHLRTPKIY